MDRAACALIGGLILIGAATTQAAMTVKNLGTLGTGASTSSAATGFGMGAFDVNSAGRAVGTVPSVGAGSFRGYRWNEPAGPMIDLTAGTGTWTGAAFGVNASGNVAGFANQNFTTGQPRRAYYWNSATNAYIFPVTPGGSVFGGIGSSEGYDLNDLGSGSFTMVGVADKTDGSKGAFIWKQGGGILPLGVFTAGGNTEARGINNVGNVVGQGNNNQTDFALRAFFWKPTVANGTTGAYKDLGTLHGGPATQSFAYDINNTDQVVGWSNYTSSTASTARQATLWTNVTGTPVLTGLGFLGTGTTSEAYAVCETGMVVGKSTTTGTTNERAFIWDPVNGMQDLNTLLGTAAVNAAGFDFLQQAWGISPDCKYITGFGNALGSSNNLTPFLIEVPEPGSLALLGLGIATVVFSRFGTRRRNS